MKIEQMSMLEVAEMLMAKKKTPQKFVDLAREVSEIKGLNFEEETDRVAQFYTDLTMSSKFVYCGEETFNLKNREKTELYEQEFFEEGQNEVAELQKELDLLPKKVVEFKQETKSVIERRIESFMPNFDDEEEEETEYLDDYETIDTEDFEEAEEEFAEEEFEDEYESMYDEE